MGRREIVSAVRKKQMIKSSVAIHYLVKCCSRETRGAVAMKGVVRKGMHHAGLGDKVNKDPLELLECYQNRVYSDSGHCAGRNIWCCLR
jgi:hypothetical protein